MQERDAAFKELADDIRMKTKEHYAGFIVEQQIYQLFAIFGKKFLTNEETEELRLKHFGDEDPVEKDDLLEGLQKLYDTEVPQQL